MENWVFSYIIYVPQLTYFHTSFPLSKSVTCDSHTSSMEPNRHVLIIICFSLNTTCIKCAMLRMDSRVVAVFTVFHLSTAKLGKQTWSFRPAATYVSYLLRRTFNFFLSKLLLFFLLIGNLQGNGIKKFRSRGANLFYQKWLTWFYYQSLLQQPSSYFLKFSIDHYWKFDFPMNTIFMRSPYWKCNFPTNPHVRLLVRWLLRPFRVGRSFIVGPS